MGIHKNQKGFSAIEALLILVIVGIIGGAGWYVMKANKSIDKTNSETATSSSLTPNKVKTAAENKIATPDVDTYTGWKSYEAPENYGFKYPSTWKLTLASENQHGQIELTSPDYVAYEGGYSGTVKGSIITISNHQASTDNVDAIINKTNPTGKSSYSDIKALTINGIKAVQYSLTNYEGPKYKATQLEKNGVSYYVLLEEMNDNSDFNDNLQIYSDIAQSFTVN